jgi:aryl-alcohol dehydrogenase-like predicted oxidoreductase
MARRSRRESLRLLETALDAGITHFDVARSYGYGAAESAVGDLLGRHRDEVTVATKFGIVPPRRSVPLSAARAAARAAATVSPRLRARLRRGAESLVAPGRFGVDDARASVEQSLRELRTDHVDVLLLHEPRPEDVGDELVAFCEDCVRRGVAGAVGVAGDRDTVLAIERARPGFVQVAQIPDSVLAPPLPAFAAPLRITHSAFGGGPRDPGEARRMLAGALERNAGGTVLIWSSSEEHIRANARVLDDL